MDNETARGELAGGRRTGGAGRVARVDPGWAAVAVLILIAVSPLFRPGLPDIADAPIHLFRTAEWVRNWQAGILVPRWSPTLAYGYGYPLFVFAPPLPYAVAGSFHLGGLSLVVSLKLLSIGCFALAGVGMYLLARCFYGSLAGVVATAAYLLAPFLLREAYLYGGNYPQLLAISLYPAILWAFHRQMQTGRSRHFLLATALYGALMLSHNFHALIFTPLLGLFVLGDAFFLQPRRFGRRLGRAALPLLLGLGWTAYFWLPALIERQWTRAQEEIYLSVSPFYLRFLSLGDLFAPPVALDSAAANPALPFTLGIVIALLAAVGLLLALARAGRRWPALLFGAVLLVVVFMLLPASEWLWANVPFLAIAEFPWRLMGLAALSCALLAGAAVSHRSWTRWSILIPTAVVLAIVFGSAVYLYPPKAFVTYGPQGTPGLADQVRYERDTGTIGSTTLGEYLSLWVEEVPRTLPLARDMLAGRPVEKLDRSALPAGVEAKLLAHKPNLDRYAFAAEQPFVARFQTFYFPGWQATLDGEPVDIQIAAPYGLIEVPIPAGEHELLLRFGETPLRQLADLISLLSLAAIAVLALIAYRRSRGQRAADEGAVALPWRAVLILTALLLVLFAGKVLLVDPHTSWFRRQSPPGQVLGISHPARVSLEDQVLFLGYDVDREVVRAGQPVRLTLYWQALRPIEVDYNVFAHLDAPPYGTTMLAADSDPPGDAQAQIDIPTTHWQTDSYVRDEHRFTIPGDLPPVVYTLRVGLYDPVTGEGLGEAIELQPLRVLPARPLSTRQVPNRVEYRLGERIELLGYEIEAGPPPTLTLYWRAEEPPEQDYVVFVHILDEGGEMVAQQDGPPMEGVYPTSDWWPGQIVTDRRTLPQLPPGGRLLVGMYDLDTMQRLPACDGDGQRLPDDAIPLDIAP